MTETRPIDSNLGDTPQVKDKSPRPAGILPKNMQSWAILGIALVMILVISLSGGKTPREASDAPAKAPSVIDPNESRILEYRSRIEEDARKLALEQERLRQTKDSIGAPVSPESPISASKPTTQLPVQSMPGYEERQPPKPDKTDVERERERREYQSLFASNIALSYRETGIAGKEAAPPVAGSSQPMAILPQSPYGPLPASMPALPAPWPQVQAAGQQPANPTPTESAQKDNNPRPMEKQPAGEAKGQKQPIIKSYPLYEGTILDAVLTNRLDGAFAGPVNCMLVTDVYSRDGAHLLIPRGSRLLGEASKVDQFGQERLAISFHRLIMPDGFSVHLDRTPGLDQAGETGLRDQVNNHYARIFGVSIAIGALSGLTQYNTRYGLDASSEDLYRQGVSRSLADSSMRILDRFLNVLPTFTVREGHRTKIYLTSDLFLPAYGQHRQEGGLR